MSDGFPLVSPLTTDARTGMTYEEFEWHILRMAYEEGVERLRPPMLAYALGIPHDRVSSYLEQAAHNGVLEMDVTADGMLEYFVPGVDASSPLPSPVWREESEATDDADPADEDGFDGSIDGEVTRSKSRKKVDRSQIPPSLRAAIQERYDGADGGTQGQYVVGQGSIEDEWQRAGDEGAMVLHDADDSLMPLRVESTDEAFCDPSRTMFMRQIRVYGSQSQQTLRDQCARLFQSFGYRVVDSTSDRMRFERGSVMFILALVPLFVLVVPLFVYLVLYCTGRSTIQQEPLELDVQFRRAGGAEPFWEIDLTFVGLHGVVLGAADQRVLNREIDTLREELRWALTGT